MVTNFSKLLLLMLIRFRMFYTLSPGNKLPADMPDVLQHPREFSDIGYLRGVECETKQTVNLKIANCSNQSNDFMWQQLICTAFKLLFLGLTDNMIKYAVIKQKPT